MSFRAKIRLASYAAALFVAMFAALAACHIGAGGYTVRIDAQSARAFGEAIDAVDQLRNSLLKCELAKGASMQNDVCTQIYSAANSAETALSMLPVDTDTLESISRSVSVLGDYAYSLTRSTSEGVSLSEENLSRLNSFSDSTGSLFEQLTALRHLFQEHLIVSEQFNHLTDSMDNLDAELEQSAGTFDSEFHEIADQFQEPDHFFYDGIFCDRSDECARMLEGRESVSEQEAREAAAAFLQIDPEIIRPVGKSEGDIPCWRFQIWEGENASFIAVTVSGGFVIRYLSPQDMVSDEKSSSADARKAFLASRGYEGFAAAPFASDGGAECYAPLQEGVLSLTDHINVLLNSDTGELYSFDATAYIKNHHERDNSIFSNTELARDSVPENTVITEEFNVWILSPGDREIPCRAFLCELNNGGRALIYVDLMTNEQVRIELEGEFIA